MSSLSDVYNAPQIGDLRRIVGSNSQIAQADAPPYPDAHRSIAADARAAGGSRWQPIRVATLIAADLVALGAAIAISMPLADMLTGMAGARAAPLPSAGHAAVAVAAALILVLSLQGRYHDRLGFWKDLHRTFRIAIAACALFGLIGAVTGAAVTSWMLVCLGFPVLAAAGRRIAATALDRAGLWTIPVLIVGDAADADEAEAALRAGRRSGYRIAGRVSPDAVTSANAPQPLRSLLAAHHAERVLIAVSGDEQKRLAVAQALRERVDFSVMLPASLLPSFATEAAQPFACGATLLLPRQGHRNTAARATKAVFDVVGAALLLAVLTPLLLIIAALVRRDGGPALYAHRRLGMGGRSFSCLKFRTMVVDGDAVLADALARDPALAAEWAAARKLRNDPRVTPIGRILRKTSLDELPQLFNVLRLDMSLVGPRPIVSNEVPFYGADIAHYCAGRPGLTGLWQVSGRSNTSYQRRVQLDVWYVNNWTLWSDIVVLLKTIPAVVAGDGAA